MTVMPETPKVGLIGLGGITLYGHAPALKELGVKIQACADVDEARVKLFKERFGCNGYTDYKEMLAKESPNVVLVATPHGLHAQIASDAIEAGAHVLLEKPMATSFEEALKLAETAHRRERMLVINHEYRFERRRQVAKKLVKEGALGKVYFGRGFYTRQRGIPTTPTFIKRELAKGGAVLDIGSHVVDLLLYLTDFPKPVSVVGRTYSMFQEERAMFSSYPLPPPPTVRSEVEDMGVTLVNLEDGLSFYVESSWAAFIRDPKFEVTLLGNKGGLQVNSELHYVTLVAGEMVVGQPLVPHQQENAFNKVWSTYLDAVSKGVSYPPAPLCSADQAALNVSILEGLYKSASEGKEVRLDIPQSLLQRARSSR